MKIVIQFDPSRAVNLINDKYVEIELKPFCNCSLIFETIELGEKT
jgi:hypothetical protein